MAEWIEEITYKGQEPGTRFKIQLGAYSAVITRNHIHYKNEWVISFDGKQYQLNLSSDTPVSTAKQDALLFVSNELRKKSLLARAAMDIAQAALDAAGATNE